MLGAEVPVGWAEGPGFWLAGQQELLLATELGAFHFPWLPEMAKFSVSSRFWCFSATGLWRPPMPWERASGRELSLMPGGENSLPIPALSNPLPTYPDLRCHRALHQLEVLAHVEAVAVEADLEDAHLLLVHLQRPHAYGGLQRPSQAAGGAAPWATQRLGDGGHPQHTRGARS